MSQQKYIVFRYVLLFPDLHAWRPYDIDMRRITRTVCSSGLRNENSIMEKRKQDICITF